MDVKPSLAEVQKALANRVEGDEAPKYAPVVASISGEFHTPTSTYLKLKAQSVSQSQWVFCVTISDVGRASTETRLSFLLESAATTETIGRYSFIGVGVYLKVYPSENIWTDTLRDPRKVLKTGLGHGEAVDPLPGLSAELSQHKVAYIPNLALPPLTGGAIGYVGYDCVQYFEPKTKRDLKDVLQVPESFFMFYDKIVAFDHFYQTVKVITYLTIPSNLDELEGAYDEAKRVLRNLVEAIQADGVPLPDQRPIQLHQEFKSNIGKEGYMAHVDRLKKHITCGDIIQAVPSQRVARPSSLHPFNIYRQLRTLNPSPYLFYLDCDSFQIVGASPELLVKSEDGRIITHPIAGTVKRGRTVAEDDALSAELLASVKDRAEHIMLVDLARNDVNRVCDPYSTRVDRLMVVERFSHVQHLVSQVSGVLRAGMTRFDAFRSIFPAGTVSGAPKVRAMELIAELEGEKRGVYAGAVGYFGYDSVGKDGVKSDDANKDSANHETGKHGEENFKGGGGAEGSSEGAMDTCIALRTMVVKDGVVYLQAGGGIVYDSVAEDEWVETLNKLGANQQCIAKAEEAYHSQQQMKC